MYIKSQKTCLATSETYLVYIKYTLPAPLKIRKKKNICYPILQFGRGIPTFVHVHLQEIIHCFQFVTGLIWKSSWLFLYVQFKHKINLDIYLVEAHYSPAQAKYKLIIIAPNCLKFLQVLKQYLSLIL